MVMDTASAREQLTSCTVPVSWATNLSFWEGPYFISLSLQGNKMIYDVELTSKYSKIKVKVWFYSGIEGTLNFPDS